MLGASADGDGAQLAHWHPPAELVTQPHPLVVLSASLGEAVGVAHWHDIWITFRRFDWYYGSGTSSRQPQNAP